MSPLAVVLGIIYNLVGAWLVWYTWPVWDDYRHFRAVNCVFMQALWPIYALFGAVFTTMTWLIDDDVRWGESWRRGHD